MKKQLLLSAIAMLFALHLNAQSYIGGVISVDTTLLLANSPYIVTNNLLVQEGKKVVVEPGVTFKFQQGIYLQVDGEFQAIGSDQAPVTFTKDSLSGATNWNGIRFTDSSIDYDQSIGSGCVLNNCIIEYAYGVVDIHYCAPLINFCQIRNCGTGIIIYVESPAPTISNNTFHNINGTVLWTQFGWGLIHGNEIYDCVGSDQVVLLGREVFTDNYIHNCTGYTQIIRVWDTVILNNNIIANNTGAAIALTEGDGFIIKCNTFINNDINVVITCERYPLVINNNFFNYQTWNVLWSDGTAPWSSSFCSEVYGSGNYAIEDFSNNYWGGLTNAQMDASIWDFNDDFSLKALIEYTPTFPDSVNFSTADCSYPSVGINEVSANHDDMIEIYPNPFHDMSYIKVKSIVLNEKYKVVIFDNFGRMVRQIQVTNPERIQVNRDGLTAGMYAYQLISPGKKVYAGKFIVQ